MELNNLEINECRQDQPAVDGGLSSELKEMDLSSQRSIRQSENERMNAAAQAYLPDLFMIFDGEKEEDAPKTCGDGGPAKKLADAEELKGLSEKTFDIIDKDSDGYLSKGELDEAMNNPCFKGEDAQTLVALRDKREKLQSFSNDEWGSENTGISKSDINEFNKDCKAKREEIEKVRTAKYFSEDNFDKLDADSDGHLTGDELEEALKNDKLSNGERQAIKTLRDRLSDIEEAENDEWGDENDGMTKKDMEEYWSELKEDNKTIFDIEHSFFHSGSRLNDSNHNLFVNKDTLDGIKADALQQGDVGDCAFLAALSATAQSNPQAIKNMIKDNGNGTYTVTFPGDPNNPVTVNAPTDAELATYCTSGENGTWPAVMEKAYGKYIKEQNGGEGSVVLAENAESQSPEKALKLLTGKDPVKQDPSDMTNEELDAMFKNRANYPMSAGIKGEFFAPLGISDNKDDETGLQRAHAYTVVGYDPVRKEVILRNPHGEASKTGPNGEELADTQQFRMSLDQFKKTFTRVSHS